MDYTGLYLLLKKQFPNLKIEKDFPLAPLTTLNIGGPADIFIETKTNDELVNILKFLGQFPALSTSPTTGAGEGLENGFVTMLGNGSGILIADAGIRGITIKNTAKTITIHYQSSSNNQSTKLKNNSTHRLENEPQKYLNFGSLDYDETGYPTVDVTLDAGVLMPQAITFLLNQGITGLQWFAYIPASIGGATWYNLHGGSYHFADYIQSAEVFDLKELQIKHLNFGAEAPAKSFDYENSPFQNHPEWVILSTTLRLFKGDIDRARNVVTQWILQKSKVQPMNSAGSVFQNPSLKDSIRLWGEQKSAGWIIDHELGLKGKQSGGAQISLQHANIIINTGTSTAADYLSLVKEVQTKAKQRFNLDLKMEVKTLGM